MTHKRFKIDFLKTTDLGDNKFLLYLWGVLVTGFCLYNTWLICPISAQILSENVYTVVGIDAESEITQLHQQENWFVQDLLRKSGNRCLEM